MKKVSALLTVLFLYSTITFAQPSSTFRSADKINDSTAVEKMKYNTWEASIFAGMQNYYGDLSDNNFFPGGSKSGIFNWNAGFKVKYNFSRYFGFQGNFSYGKMASQYSTNKLSFEGSAMDFDLGVFFNITTLISPKKYNKRLYWDFSLNIGGSKYNTESFDAQDLSTGAADDMTMLLGIGSSVQYRLSDKFDIGLDARVNTVGHDMIDNVSGGKSNDAYGHVSIILGYTFGKQAESYKWNPLDDELKELWNAVNKNSDVIDSLDKRVSKLEAYHGKSEEEELADDDNDGVPNEFDQSPNTPEGTMVNFQGIPIPIADTTVVKSNNVTSEAGSGTILGSVFFDYNRSNVSRTDYRKLASVAQYLKSHNDAKVQIVGHTDTKGSDEYNEKLSKKRSDAVIKILTEGFGIDSSRLEVVAKGKKTNLSDKYDDVNRRVDVIVK
jgi:OOP family OmpA-OmpF porin